MPVTLREVAARVGVTPVVVSHVLHNKATGIRVSPATAQKIREAAEDMGYRVNVWARNFRSQQTMSIGVLHGTGFPRPMFDRGSRYFASLMDGIVEGSFRHGYSVTLCPKLLGEDSSDGFNDGRFDGLIWYNVSPAPEMKEQLVRSRVPIVILHGRARDYGGQIPTVICDNQQAIRSAIEHLHRLGHQKIAYFYDQELMLGENIERRDAFLAISSELNLPITGQDLMPIDWGRIALVEYFSKPLAHTAGICCNDGMAADLLAIASEKGVKIPEQFSVVGFDSTAFCNELRPSLTSVHQPLSEMGSAAIEQLVKRISGQPLEPLELVIPCGFDVRESTGPAPKINLSR